MQKREGNLAGKEGLLSQAEHDRGVLADRVEHHGAGKLGHSFTKDVNACGLQGSKMVEVPALGRKRMCLRMVLLRRFLNEFGCCVEHRFHDAPKNMKWK